VKKTKTYNHTIFDANTLQIAKAKFDEISGFKLNYTVNSYVVTKGAETWYHDNFDEYLADYRNPDVYSNLLLQFSNYQFDLTTSRSFKDTTVGIAAPTRQEIEAIFSIFEDNALKFYSPPQEKDDEEELVIFIGHGQNIQWKELKDHLHEKHGFKIVAYETGARAGHTIRDILDSLLDESSFAILVLTGEDETTNGNIRARQNVIHETGLFQGRLGFDRAIVLLEGDTEEFSNIAGIQQIRYSKGKIIETFGEVLATIRREFIE
jgi:Predicted nucleotide-binding protein containing TIR-like domain